MSIIALAGGGGSHRRHRDIHISEMCFDMFRITAVVKFYQWQWFFFSFVWFASLSSSTHRHLIVHLSFFFLFIDSPAFTHHVRAIESLNCITVWHFFTATIFWCWFYCCFVHFDYFSGNNFRCNHSNGFWWAWRCCKFPHLYSYTKWHWLLHGWNCCNIANLMSLRFYDSRWEMFSLRCICNERDISNGSDQFRYQWMNTKLSSQFDLFKYTTHRCVCEKELARAKVKDWRVIVEI